MKITMHEHFEHTVLSLEGGSNIYTVQELKDTLQEYIDRRIESLVVDMKKVTAVDSSTIGALFMAHRKMNALGGKFFLTNLPEEIERIVTLSGLDFQIIDLEKPEN